MNEDILEEALGLTKGDRNKDYGDYNVESKRIAALWSIIFDKEITQNQVVLAMIALKMGRQLHTNKRDNWVDIAGYARLGDMIND